jgi:D-glycerate 3-kinase
VSLISKSNFAVMANHKLTHTSLICLLCTHFTMNMLQLGISAPQGCGKSTLVEQLELLFTWLGTAAAGVSIDDFYLTNAGQTALAAAQPDNRLLALRGNAGSHDLELGTATLKQLKGLTAKGQTAAVPR